MAGVTVSAGPYQSVTGSDGTLSTSYSDRAYDDITSYYLAPPRYLNGIVPDNDAILYWQAPADSTGELPPGILGYNVYGTQF